MQNQLRISICGLTDFVNLPVSVKQKRCPANALQKGFNLKWLEGLWNKRI